MGLACDTVISSGQKRARPRRVRRAGGLWWRRRQHPVRSQREQRRERPRRRIFDGFGDVERRFGRQFVVDRWRELRRCLRGRRSQRDGRHGRRLTGRFRSRGNDVAGRIDGRLERRSRRLRGRELWRSGRSRCRWPRSGRRGHGREKRNRRQGWRAGGRRPDEGHTRSHRVRHDTLHDRGHTDECLLRGRPRHLVPPVVPGLRSVRFGRRVRRRGRLHERQHLLPNGPRHGELRQTMHELGRGQPSATVSHERRVQVRRVPASISSARLQRVPVAGRGYLFMLHMGVPGGHARPQIPALQGLPLGHLMPQPPQLLPSIDVFTHAEPHFA